MVNKFCQTRSPVSLDVKPHLLAADSRSSMALPTTVALALSALLAFTTAAPLRRARSSTYISTHLLLTVAENSGHTITLALHPFTCHIVLLHLC